MREIFHTINPELDFFSVYPEFKIKEPFSGKESEPCWAAVYMYSDSSPFRKLPEEERLDILKDEYFGNIKRFSKFLREAKEVIHKLEESPARRHLRSWESKMDEKSKYLDEIPYNSETYKDIDTMLLNNDKIFKTYFNILKDLQKEEETDGKLKGDSEPSLSDTGEI